MATYNRSLTMYNLVDTAMYYISSPMHRSVAAFLFILRRAKQFSKGRCRFCNSLSPIWNLHSRPNLTGSRPFITEFKATNILKGSSTGCAHCYLILIAIHCLLPEISDIEVENVRLRLSVWAHRPVDIDVCVEGISDLHLQFYRPSGTFTKFPKFLH